MARLHALAMPAPHKSWLSILGVTDSFASGALYLFLNDIFAELNLLSASLCLGSDPLCLVLFSLW